MKLSIAAAVFASAASSAAIAAPIELTCNGTLHQYLPTVVHAALSPTVAQVDLEAMRISTPFGRYGITSVDNSSVSFNGTWKGFLVAGALDRTSGAMNMRWLSKEEQTKLDRGEKAQMGMSADLKCSVASRLF